MSWKTHLRQVCRPVKNNNFSWLFIETENGDTCEPLFFTSLGSQMTFMKETRAVKTLNKQLFGFKKIKMHNMG